MYTISTPWGAFIPYDHSEDICNYWRKCFSHPTGSPFLSWVLSGKWRLMHCQRTLMKCNLFNCRPPSSNIFPLLCCYHYHMNEARMWDIDSGGSRGVKKGARAPPPPRPKKNVKISPKFAQNLLKNRGVPPPPPPPARNSWIRPWLREGERNREKGDITTKLKKNPKVLCLLFKDHLDIEHSSKRAWVQGRKG